jgi:hypothetical protein
MLLAFQKFLSGVIVGAGLMGFLTFLVLTIGSGIFSERIGTGSYIIQIVLGVPAVGVLSLILGIIWATQKEKYHVQSLLILLGVTLLYSIGVLIFSFGQRFGMF